MSTITITEEMEVTNCIDCGMAFAYPKDYDRRRREDHKNFFCPSGHQQCYMGKTEAEKLRDQLAQKQVIIDDERRRGDRLASELRSANFKVNAERAAKSRLKHRVGRGVCPCCSRSFENLRRHMQTKHPEQLAAES